MKKLIMTIAIVLGLGMGTFAQEMEYQERGLFGKGEMTRDGIFSGLVLPSLEEDDAYTTDENQDAPLGSGIALLMGLGGAYLVGKKRREE